MAWSGSVGTKYDHSFCTKNDACSGCETQSLQAECQSYRPDFRNTVFIPVSCWVRSKWKL